MTLNASRVKELFEYSEGRLVRKVSRGNTKTGATLNTKSSKGYIRVLVDGRRYTEHQLVWVYFNDYLPDVIDHINGIKTDNRIENLRAVTVQQNCANTIFPKKNNSLGILGVCKVPSGKYRAQRTFLGRKYWSRLCNTVEEATVEYQKLKAMHGY